LRRGRICRFCRVVSRVMWAALTAALRHETAPTDRLAGSCARLSRVRVGVYGQLDSPMTIELAEEPITALTEYARIPIVFTVDRVLDVTARLDGPRGGFVFSERCLAVPYEKDYDAFYGEGPLQWHRRFD